MSSAQSRLHLEPIPFCNDLQDGFVYQKHASTRVLALPSGRQAALCGNVKGSDNFPASAHPYGIWKGDPASAGLPLVGRASSQMAARGVVSLMADGVGLRA